MNPQKSTAKDFFLNLGAIIALGTTVGNLISLLFTVINKAYPTTTGYDYYTSYSISWPVASLIIFFPVYILLMWLLERGYAKEPENRHVGIRKWLTYITLFFAGLSIAGDLVYVLYAFIDGQEMTTGFIMKALSVLVIALGIFYYYISDSMGKLNGMSRKVWAGVFFVVILGSVVWGFSVLGSPRTQQLLKYDQQKVNDLMSINQYVISYYQTHAGLPGKLADLSASDNYFSIPTDPQSGKAYEYVLVGQRAKAYQVCAEFNKASEDQMQGPGYTAYINVDTSKVWTHPAGRFCFSETIPVDMYTNPPKLAPIR